MLFRGGDCSENNFSQPITKVNCTDYPQNGDVPKNRSNQTAYIVATAVKDPTIIVFQGYAREGSVFFLYNGGVKLPADTRIQTFAPPAEPGPPLGQLPNTPILQSVDFHASCSQPFVLKNVFGAYQLVQFQNPEQGNVSCFSATELDYNVSVPIKLPSGEDTIIIQSAQLVTNYTSPRVVILPLTGTRLCSEAAAAIPNNNCTSDITVNFEVFLNLAIPQGYSTTLFVIGRTENTGQLCTGVGKDEFFAPLNEQPL